jgi:uncharacterized protein
MFHNVAQLLKEGIGATRRMEISGDLLDVDENNMGPTHVEGKAVLLRTETGILVTAHVRVKLVQLCRRCLEPMQREVRITLEEEFVPSIDIRTGVRLPTADKDSPELVIDEHHILDLTEVLRQHVVINGVGFGLCRRDCKGLCPECGHNLNLGPCQCAFPKIDPRLAVLSGLLESREDTAKSD